MLPCFGAAGGGDGTTAAAAGTSLGGEGGWGEAVATAGKEGVDTIDVQGGADAVRVASAATAPPLHGAGAGPRWSLVSLLGSAEEAAEAMRPGASTPTAADDPEQGEEGATGASAAA